MWPQASKSNIVEYKYHGVSKLKLLYFYQQTTWSRLSLRDDFTTNVHTKIIIVGVLHFWHTETLEYSWSTSETLNTVDQVISDLLQHSGMDLRMLNRLTGLTSQTVKRPHPHGNMPLSLLSCPITEDYVALSLLVTFVRSSAIATSSPRSSVFLFQINEWLASIPSTDEVIAISMKIASITHRAQYQLNPRSNARLSLAQPSSDPSLRTKKR